MRTAWPKPLLILLLPSLFFILTISSCNIFERLKPEVMGSSAADYNDRGDRYYEKHDYLNSLACYSNALLLKPDSSRARMGFARSKLWHFLPDLMISVSIYQSSRLEAIIPLLNDSAVQTLIRYQNQQNVFQEIVAVLNSQNGIINGAGDGIIKADNLELNEILSLCYASQFALSALNTSNDNAFASSGDVFILSNGRITTEVDFPTYFTNIIAATNVSAATSVSNAFLRLSNSYETLSSLLDTVSLIGTSTAYLNALASSLLRPATALQSIDSNLGFYSATYNNLYEELSDALTNTNNASTFKVFFNDMYHARSLSEGIGSNLNTLHEVIVGYPAYYNSVANYSKIPWNWYTTAGPSGGLKGIIITNILSNMIVNSNTYSNWITNIGGTNIVTNTVTNTYTNTLYMNAADANTFILSITNVFSPAFKAYLDSLAGGL